MLRLALIVSVLMSLAAPAAADDGLDCRTLNGEDAIAPCTKAIATAPKDSELYLFRAVAFFFTHKFNRAVDDAGKAIDLKPGLSDAFTVRAMALARKGDAKRALADYDRALELTPDSPDAYYGRGLVRAKAGPSELALSDLARAIYLDPEFVNAFEELARLHLKQGRFAAAVAASNRAISLNPRRTELYLLRSQALARTGDKAGADADARKARELGPLDVTVTRITLHFDIAGVGRAQLLDKMDAFGIHDHLNGNRSDAVTKSFSTWNFMYRPGGGGCRILSGHTELAVAQLMPRWVNKAEGDAGLQASWERRNAALLRHENHHAQVSTAAAYDVETAILGGSLRKGTCPAMEKAANAKADAAYGASDKIQDAFDLAVMGDDNDVPPL
jgi:Flp pilus assembly protein TadD/predicted secreted Zn-dependent protease